MRRAILLLSTMALIVLVVGGIALAESVTCDSTPPCYGTPEGDSITGTASGETINAQGGNDNVFASDGNDTVYGSSGNDAELFGNGGSDKVYGGGGGDAINAYFWDTQGSTDYSYGGGGNDTISAQDNNRDIINCGKGTDRVFYDEGIDTITACEIKNQ